MHKDNDHRFITTVVNEEKKNDSDLLWWCQYWDIGLQGKQICWKKKNERQRPCGSFVLVFAIDEERLCRFHDSIHPTTDSVVLLLVLNRHMWSYKKKGNPKKVAAMHWYSLLPPRSNREKEEDRIHKIYSSYNILLCNFEKFFATK